ncbi:Ig-like domain-containing protein [Dysgonomonas sp. 25]|uniref:Ig-like domain-containing protein n=1 Tax=Dysgonomonas sp. 25 TaxID=2302933 RepID=UPI0013D8B079|nr:Ig-like domain-containing protein [Dysgonomonas sp. 25]NDV69488.1 hypothetical protein [Dysgonomonas sp. 25]
MIQFAKKHWGYLVVIAAITLVVSCANQGTPSGGEYDLEPPKVVKITPDFNATNIKDGRIEILFDENVVVEKPNEKVIVTPPQQKDPIIRSVNRKVTVTLRDTLLPNTTYTIDFTDAIADNNEKNILENFSYSFSTGDIIDSLAISGKVVTADNVEPVKGILVGLHSNLEDSTFITTRFERISKTNDRGEFTIRGVAPGRYRIYALNDNSRTFKYTNPNQPMAFLDTIIEPWSMPDVHPDTTFTVKNGEATVDTIVDVQFTRFMPDNIVLRSFVSDFRRRYLQKHERTPNQVKLYFGAPTEMPEIEPLSFDKEKDWAILEKYVTNDTLIYWIKDPAIMAMDTLLFRVNYLKTDTLNIDELVTDTLTFTDRTRKPKKEDKKRRKDDDEEEPVVLLEIKQNLAAQWDIYENITFEMGEPIVGSLDDKIRLQKAINDSTYTDAEGYTIQQDSLNPRLFTLRKKWNYDESYKLTVDSATIYSIYGLWNGPIEQEFKVKSKDAYGVILINVSGLGDTPVFAELLDKSDKTIRKVRVYQNLILFRNVNPGEYYVRIVFDENNNGIWDTGNYYKHRQPERVFYYDKPINIRANMEVENVWALNMETDSASKPLEVTKNKPQARESKKEQLEKAEKKKEEDKEKQRRGQQSNASGRGGMDTNPYNMGSFR